MQRPTTILECMDDPTTDDEIDIPWHWEFSLSLARGSRQRQLPEAPWPNGPSGRYDKRYEWGWPGMVLLYATAEVLTPDAY